MPAEAGLDVMEVDFLPLLESFGSSKTLEDDLNEISDALAGMAAGFTLPTDILEMGKTMADAYLYLYAVENYLRLFIEQVGIGNFGADYLAHFSKPRNIVNTITTRKEQEGKNQWMGVRGGSDLFYLDFKDLGVLILNNWEVFKSFFPDQAWIDTKINELANCRNLVAHNSVIGEHERDVIRVNFRSILKQLNPVMR